MIEINLKKKHIKFMKILNSKELSLGVIGSKMGLKKYGTQRIFNSLEKSGMVVSRKQGRKRLVKLNKNGKYFNEFYKRQRRKRK